MRVPWKARPCSRSTSGKERKRSPESTEDNGQRTAKGAVRCGFAGESMIPISGRAKRSPNAADVDARKVPRSTTFLHGITCCRFRTALVYVYVHIHILPFPVEQKDPSFPISKQPLPSTSLFPQLAHLRQACNMPCTYTYTAGA